MECHIATQAEVDDGQPRPTVLPTATVFVPRNECEHKGNRACREDSHEPHDAGASHPSPARPTPSRHLNRAESQHEVRDGATGQGRPSSADKGHQTDAG